MKKIQYLFATIVLSFALTSCSDSFLNQHPEGATLLEDQYAQLPDNLTGSIMGIYSKLYEYGGEHDVFGQRSIDMYGDFQCGDMAMKNMKYGWFSTFDRGYFYVYARSYIWPFYYDIISSANSAALAVESNVPEMISRIATDDPSNTIIEQAYYYGQVLALRGWAYANLLNYYCDPMDGIDLDATNALPVYTEAELKAGVTGAPLSTVTEVYDRVYEDLSLAIELLDYYGEKHARGSKLEIDADVARLMLAYAMLNHGHSEITIAGGQNAYEIAFDLAKAVIDGGNYTMMKQNELTTTGFSNVEAANWMWGEDVTVENTTALASFFSQVDIYTYGYANLGDIKGIDSKLYEELAGKGWDARVKWFNAGNVANAYAPAGKFYCPTTKASGETDRSWLCDNIFMRFEVAYLIAAEAAYFSGSVTAETDAANYLDLLCRERVIPGKETEYDTWKGTLSGTALKDAIAYNWRVEMWGEGYGLQTFRRLTKSVTLGSNHLDTRQGQTITPTEAFQCEIPTTETRYNPYLSNREPAQDDK